MPVRIAFGGEGVMYLKPEGIDSGGAAIRFPITARFTNMTEMDYDAEVELSRQAGDRLGVSRFEVVQREGGPAITAEGLRGVRLGRLVEDAIRRIAFPWTPPGHSGNNRPTKAQAVSVALRRMEGRRGRRTSDAELREVAKVAKRAPERGSVKAVMGARPCSKPQAQRLIRAAREAGFLEHSTRSQPKRKRRR